MALQELSQQHPFEAKHLDYLRPAAPDNYLAHLAPFSAGAIYFGNFCPQHRDSPATRQALFKTSFLYRHFLAPAGLKVSMEERIAVLSGKIDTAITLRLGEALAMAIDGVEEVKDQTVRSSASSEESEMCARFRFALASDTLLAKENLSVTMTDGHVTIFGNVSSAATRAWARDYLEALGDKDNVILAIEENAHEASETTLPRIDGDSLHALIQTRLGLSEQTKGLKGRLKSRRQRVQYTAKATSTHQSDLATEIIRHTYGVREAKCQIDVQS